MKGNQDRQRVVLHNLWISLRSVSFILCLLLFQFQLFAQAREESGDRSSGRNAPAKSGFDMDKVVVGGNLGLQFGTITLIEVSPTIGYRFTDKILAGLGGRYIYFEDNTFGSSFSTNIYGGNIFSQYFILENFLTHVEYELLNLQAGFDRDERIDVSSFFVGGGYRSSLGGNSYASILLLYDLIGDRNSPYSNPILRVGFAIGL